MKTPTAITVETTVGASLEKVWEFWNGPEHIKNWAFASDDWGVPHAENDVRVGGKFTTTMAAKDGSKEFDFEGVYTAIEPLQLMEYTMSDGRKVKIMFHSHDGLTTVTETFDMEKENSTEVQRAGWQAMLDNFKKYVEQP